MENLSGVLVPFGTIFLIVLIQISFWFQPSQSKREEEDRIYAVEGSKTSTATASSSVSEPNGSVGSSENKVGSKLKNNRQRISTASNDTVSIQTFSEESFHCIVINEDQSSKSQTRTGTKLQIRSSSTTETSEESRDSVSNRNPTEQTKANGRLWKCSCELGFLSSGVLKTFGNAEAMMRLGVGQCYHKKM